MPWIVTSTERVCVPAWSIHSCSRWTGAPTVPFWTSLAT
jgi:hypothetical protein